MTTSIMKRLLLISNSTMHGGGYLEHCQDNIKAFLSTTARKAFNSFGYDLDGIHEKENPVDAVRNAEAIFIGGGNTFRLLKTLYDENIVNEIYKQVTQDGVPYMGSSAGSNVATISINTTNDMPIVYPPSFKGIGLVPFNINAHYTEPDANSKHMGETRAQRINQYHEYEDAPPVLGLREGCILHVEGNKATLEGKTNAKLFVRLGKEPVEYEPGSDISFLLNV
ncbi:hypothetical protein KUTeg_022381 [Tegillarca granosa]|uniref:Alpha-aspartyl dipeptidase n=1 Tax=Tegillarca granosa TaxID=220873 RepID=A0ABQ9E6F1_TEGGR|nr:hypothetical protein KUTeg_022381 [Tegillarca granosa]